MPKKKLLVLDVNGLLLATYFCKGKCPNHSPDGKVGKFFAYKRPFCGDFIQFCLENFVVGVWSSTREYKISINWWILYLGKGNKILLFVGFSVMNLNVEGYVYQVRISDCTDVGLKSPDNKFKPLFLKELSKLWEKVKSDLPWDKGDYGPGNTLLVDDTPYKAILNPPNTGIFPQSYTAQNEKDDFLGCELQKYLQGIVDASNVQKYVESNPIGEPSITSASPLWSYVERIMKRINKVSIEVGEEVSHVMQFERSNGHSEQWHGKRKRHLSTPLQTSTLHFSPSEEVEFYSREEQHQPMEDKIHVVQGHLEKFSPGSCWQDRHTATQHFMDERFINRSLPIPEQHLHNSNGRIMNIAPSRPWESVDANQMIHPSYQVTQPFNNWHIQSATNLADLEGNQWQDNSWRSLRPIWQVMNQGVVCRNVTGYQEKPTHGQSTINPVDFERDQDTSWRSSRPIWKVLNQGMMSRNVEGVIRDVVYPNGFFRPWECVDASQMIHPSHLVAQPFCPERNATNLADLEINQDHRWNSSIPIWQVRTQGAVSRNVEEKMHRDHH